MLEFCSIYSAKAYDEASFGGAIYAEGNITLDLSRILNSTAGHGAAFRAEYNVVLSRSLIQGNQAVNDTGSALSGYKISVASTTIANNRGNLRVVTARDLEVFNSTISGNSASYNGVYYPDGGYEPAVGGLDSTLVSNSTIVNNTFHNVSDGACDAFALGGPKVHLESSIVANTSCDGVQVSDIRISDTSTPQVVTGANNLVTRAHPTVTLPADTLSADPRLEPLADNGGFFQTHALAAGSPALDAGNNAAGLAWDQRGYEFPRVKNGRADIGAFER